MNILADILLLLSSYSLRTNFVRKAVHYAKAGFDMFPDDLRLREIYAYALLMDDQVDEAERVASGNAEPSSNIAYVLARVVLLKGDATREQRKQALQKYLTLRAQNG